MDEKKLKQIAREVRKDILTAVHAAKTGHPGGSLSAADLFVYLYFEEMNVDPAQPQKEDRDRFVLSKGHTAPGLYATLAEKGYFSKDKLLTLRKTDSMLQGHPDMKRTPGIDMSTGSLGQGISAAVGMALAAKMQQKTYRVYAMLGDGELQEGQVWEALMFAAHHKLDNLTVIVDNNNLQIDGTVQEINSPYPIDQKFMAFQFHAITIDGHNFNEIHQAMREARSKKGQPTVIIARTRKGKGVSFMENQVGWHGKAPDDEQCKKALAELENDIIQTADQEG